uniref:Uncharacterized protein n=1 Tax=Roseihalotalea indica TaxID=2867963 RepID=A0AA49GJB5_9BACT|nr:hypothetical protein K4G66_25780 [Tunicatimonas sp. TK19036]
MNIVINFSSLVFAIVISFAGFTTSLAESIAPTNKSAVEAFELTSQANQVVFSWDLAEDVEGVTIVVERAGMDGQFEVVGQGKEVVKQQFVDHNPQVGMSYYRLAIRHADGHIDYLYHPAMSVVRGKATKIS